MTDNQTLEKLQNEISYLEEILSEINPNWFDDTIREYAENGIVSDSICVPIRAAIKLLCPGNELDAERLS